MKEKSVLRILIICCFMTLFMQIVYLSAATRPQVPVGRIVASGIYDIVKMGFEYEHKESTAGRAIEGVEVLLVEATTNIPLKKGITFGFDWEAEGLPDIPLNIVMRVKHPPTTKPDGTVLSGFDEILPFFPENGRIETRGDYYNLSEDWELLPGEWTLSILYEGKVLCSEVFQVVAP